MAKSAAYLIGGVRLIVAGMLISTSSFGLANPQSKQGWNFVGHFGSNKVVTLERKSKTSVEERVWSALRSVCTGTFCNVNFYWVDEYAKNKELPERMLLDHAILIYSTNYGFQWNCSFRPFADNCFTR